MSGITIFLIGWLICALLSCTLIINYLKVMEYNTPTIITIQTIMMFLMCIIISIIVGPLGLFASLFMFGDVIVLWKRK